MEPAVLIHANQCMDLFLLEKRSYIARRIIYDRPTTESYRPTFPGHFTLYILSKFLRSTPTLPLYGLQIQFILYRSTAAIIQCISAWRLFSRNLRGVRCFVHLIRCTSLSSLFSINWIHRIYRISIGVSAVCDRVCLVCIVLGRYCFLELSFSGRWRWWWQSVFCCWGGQFGFSDLY